MKTILNKVPRASVAGFLAGLLAAAAQAQPIVNFQFNEGQGRTTTDSAGAYVGEFGTVVNPDFDRVVLSDSSPSGTAGDRSISTEGAGFLVADDGATKALAFAPNEAFTIETWLNLTPGGAKNIEGIATYGGTYKLGLKAGEPVFTLFGLFDATNSGVFLPEGQWAHLAVVWEPGVGATFYQGGNSFFVARTNLTPVYKDNYLVIGAERFVNNLVASFDRLRIHRGALSAAELDTVAAAPKPVYDKTVAAYNFNEANFPVKNAKAPELPTMQSAQFLPGYTDPAWTNDTPTGKAGDYALAFNLNDPSIRQRVNVPLPSEAVDLAANGTNYTLEAWVKLPRRLINERMVIFRTAGPGPRVSMSINANRTLHTTIFGTQDIASSVRVPNDDRWHHVAVVVEDFARVHFHLDGVRAQTVNRTGTGAASSSGSPNLLIGMESDTRYYKGLLDRLRIHNRALAPEALDYPAVPGQPRITSNPTNVVADPGDIVTLAGAGSSPTASAYQWYYRSSLAASNSMAVAGATAPTLTLSNVTAASQGFYSLAISNDVGVTMSAAARVSVRSQPETLQAVWSIQPGEREYITGYNSVAGLRDLERGLAYNPVTDHLLVVARATNDIVRRIAILDAATGADLGSLKTTGISGGTFLLSRIDVADDGAIYAANFGSTSGTTAGSFLRVYRWANESAEPTLAYAGNPANGQYGKNLDVRGSGTGTQILLETRGTFVVLLVTSDGVNFAPVVIQTDARSDDFSLGTSFGEGNTFWGKNQFEPLYQWEFNLTNQTATLKRTFLDYPTENFSNFSFSPDGKYLGGLSINTGPDTVELYDLSDLNREPRLLDTAQFAADNANTVFGGRVVMGGDRLFALNSNNGLMAFRIQGQSAAPSLQIARSSGNAVISWPASATGFVLEATDRLPASSWTNVPFQTNGNTSSATVPLTGSQRYFRLRKS